MLVELTMAPGVSARQLQEVAAGIVGQPVSEVLLMNLDQPMYLVGDMRLQASTRVGIQPRVRGG